MSDLHEQPSPPPGTVYTFYSYKGGVGRSMALANVGVLLASQGLRVLLVDWDLEAPGLEVYFRQAARLLRDASETPGVVDLLEAHAEQRTLNWRDCLLRAEFAESGLDIITAGSRNEHYRRRVQQLDWESLFREHRVGNFVNDLREEWRYAYDVVLVDSRTGITDIGDICTVLLPDVLVLLFVTNHQNIEGLTAVMERATRARAKLPIQRGKLLGVPVPARDERDRESGKFEEWHKIFAQHFDPLFREWLPSGVTSSEALLRLFIPYIASWSFGECLPVLEGLRERTDPSSLGAAYSRLASLLAARLDWSAMDAKADAGELASTRLEAARARESARMAEEAKAAAEAEALAAKAIAEKELLSTKLAHEQALAMTRTRARRWLLVSILVAVLGTAIVAVLWPASRLTNQEIIEGLASSSPELRDRSLVELSLGRLSETELALVLGRIEPLLAQPDTSTLAWMNVSLYADRVGDRFAPVALASLKASVSMTRANAASYLLHLPNPERYLSAVAPLLSDADPLVRLFLLVDLRRLPPEALTAYGATLSQIAASDPDKDVRNRATELLRASGLGAPASAAK